MRNSDSALKSKSSISKLKFPLTHWSMTLYWQEPLSPTTLPPIPPISNLMPTFISSVLMKTSQVISMSNSLAIWAEFPKLSGPWLSRPKRRRTFNSHSLSTMSPHSIPTCSLSLSQPSSIVSSSLNSYRVRFKKWRRVSSHSFPWKKAKKSSIKLLRMQMPKATIRCTFFHLTKAKSNSPNDNAREKLVVNLISKYHKISMVQFTWESQKLRPLKKWLPSPLTRASRKEFMRTP